MKIGWVNLNPKERLKFLLPLLLHLLLQLIMKPSLALRKQQQQFDTLMSKVQAMVTTLQSHNAKAASTFNTGALQLDEG